jgi:Fe-S cluster assembly protein SufD
MERFELIPLQNDEIPSKIQTLTDGLENVVIIKDGHILKKDLSEEFSTVYVGSYGEALPGKIDAFLETEYCNEFSDDAYDYNINNVNSGLFVHVPKNLRVAKQLHVIYIQENVDLVQNTRLVLEDNSELDYFEYLYNEKDASINFVSNSVVKENSRLKYSAIVRFNQKAVVFMTRNSYIYRYGNSSYSIAEVSDATTISNTHIYLQEEFAVGTSKTVAITNKTQDASFKQLIEHKAPETEGYIENYGVSNNESTLVFEGIGKINKNMKRSIARQSNKGIILSEKSQLEANPLLLIDEYDVIASHGAAIGKIDDEQLYYLMSRGLTLNQAERLIISGFLSPVLRMLQSDSLKEEFISIVEEKTL